MLHYNITFLKSPSICGCPRKQNRAIMKHKHSSRCKNIKDLCFLFLLTLLPASTAHADSSGPIVVTIKPLYSLVAHLTDGIESPVLLMKQTQSPHHYNMKPSERHLLDQASTIVWLGPQMESYLTKIIQQQKSALVISTMQANNLKLLEKRKKHTHHEAHRDTAGETVDPDKTDPHIWLSTQNAIAISKQISEQLIKQDTENAQLYQNNLQQLIKKIEQTDAEIRTLLQGRNEAFISFHDAFQYFENEYALNYIDTISYDEETGTSLKHLREIKASIDTNNIHCLVYQPPKPAIIDSLVRQTGAKSLALDPLGLNSTNDKDAWFEIMQQLAHNFRACLTE